MGDRVYAIGNPFGLERTMTAGIVSATGRDIQAPNGHTISGAVQTDAPINHGNSGGPLLDRHGRVVGINAQLEGGTVDANVGIGFAIPSSTARTVASELIGHGHASHPWLGVEIETIQPSVARVVRGLPAHGVVVLRVTKGGPAARAGYHRVPPAGHGRGRDGVHRRRLDRRGERQAGRVLGPAVRPPGTVLAGGSRPARRSCVALRLAPSTSRSATCPGSRAAYHD